MTSQKIQRYLDEFNLAISMQQGEQLAKMLTCSVTSRNEIHPVNALAKLVDLPTTFLIGDDQQQQWRAGLIAHLIVLRSILDGDTEAAFQNQLSLCGTIQRIFQNTNRWLLPVVYQTYEDLWHLSCHPTTQSQQQRRQEECARALSRLITICLTDRAPLSQSRKWGFYRIVSLLFRIYFRLGQLNLGANILRAMGATELPNLLLLPRSQIVQYGYWLGRYHFVGEQWEAAEEHLWRAFIHCPVDSLRNKRLILHYLIPLRLFLHGIIPTGDLLDRYKLIGFYPLALKALRLGDLATYEAALAQFEKTLLKFGTFLLWERLELVVQRNLFKRIHLLAGGGTRLPLNTILTGMNALRKKKYSSFVDLNQVSCFVANLIAKGMIKGYISLEKSMIVLSPKDPFPKLATFRAIQ